MVYYEADSGKVHYLNAGFNTPQAEKGSALDPRQRHAERASRARARLHGGRAGSPRSLWQTFAG